MGFFAEVSQTKQLNKYAPIFDWLFEGNHFSRWEGAQKAKYTKWMKRLEGMSKENWKVLPLLSDEWRQCDNSKEASSIFIAMTSDSSECVSLIRHIRNSIAHGNCKLIKQAKEKML